MIMKTILCYYVPILNQLDLHTILASEKIGNIDINTGAILLLIKTMVN